MVNGPDAYVSARWYEDPDQVPTWNYVALEIEGPVRKMEREGLEALLEALVARHEARIEGGTVWTMDKLTEANRERMLRSITGFELEAQAWRDTLKLSQNKDDGERARLIEALNRQGSIAIAEMMRGLGK